MTATSKMQYCDKLFRTYVRGRDKVCQVGGDCWGDLQAAHFIGRSIKSVRWKPDNAALLCVKHHVELDRDPIGKHSWFAYRLGEERLTALHMASREAFHRDYAKVLADLKILLNSL
jgi:hypothetical protein